MFPFFKVFSFVDFFPYLSRSFSFCFSYFVYYWFYLSSKNMLKLHKEKRKKNKKLQINRVKWEERNIYLENWGKKWLKVKKGAAFIHSNFCTNYAWNIRCYLIWKLKDEINCNFMWQYENGKRWTKVVSEGTRVQLCHVQSCIAQMVFFVQVCYRMYNKYSPYLVSSFLSPSLLHALFIVNVAIKIFCHINRSSFASVIFVGKLIAKIIQTEIKIK